MNDVRAVFQGLAKTAILVIGFCLVFTICTTGDEAMNYVPVFTQSFTDLVDLPVGGDTLQETVSDINKAGISSISMHWLHDGQYDGGFLTSPADLEEETYMVNRYYRAVITLQAQAGYSFNGAGDYVFTHDYGVVAEAGITANTLSFTITFPLTPADTAELVSVTDLTALLPMPLKGESPQRTLDTAQFAAANIVWGTATGGLAPNRFETSSVYRAIFLLSPKTGFTMSGLRADSFKHNYVSAENIHFDVLTRRVTILFNATRAENEDDLVTHFDLTDIIIPPVHRAAPTRTPEAAQYSGNVQWFYTDVAEVVGTEFFVDRPTRAVVTLTAQDGFTFNGVPARSFFHADAYAIDNNAANEGTVTLYFNPATWRKNPETLLYPPLVNATIQACCWHTSSPVTNLINVDNPATTNPASGNIWDYGGWGGNANSGSSWDPVFRPTGVTFSGSENGQGHHSVLLEPSVPASIRRKAHVISLDLGEGSTATNIVTLGLFPRQNESASERGKRFPIHFEVFHSNDPIPPIFDWTDPEQGIHSLGQFYIDEVRLATYPWPDTSWFKWYEVDLYLRTEDGWPINARYLQIRIYGERGNGPSGYWNEPSFAQLRVGRVNTLD